MSKRLAVTDNIALAFGFTWQALDPVESKSAKLGELLSQAYKWQASFKRGGTEYIGVSKDDFRPLPKIKTLSGAALMANHPDLAGKTVWIVMEEPAEAVDLGAAGTDALAKPAQSEMVVVGLVNGNIVVDDYVTKDGFQKHRSAFLDRCAKAKAQYITAGTTYTLGAVTKPLAWNDFLPTKANKPVAVKTLEPGIHGRVLMGACVVAAVFGVVWGYTAWDTARKEQAERERRAREARNLPALYTAAVKDVLDQPVIRANVGFAELRGKLAGYPSRKEGWELGQIECLASTATCIATWTNTKNLGTNRGFANAAPKEWGAITFDPSGQSATHVLPFKLTTAALPARDTWPTHKEFLLKPYSEWQKYWILKFHPDLLTPKPHIVGKVQGLADDDAASLPDATWATDWSIKDTPWDLSDGFDKSAEKGDGNLPDSVTVNKVTLKYADKQIKFEAEGVVYERM